MIEFNLLKTLAQVDIRPDQIDLPKIQKEDGTLGVDDNTIATALELTFSIMGIIAMLIIVVAGMLFSLSRGEPEKAARARRAVIYAAVGLVVAMVAFAVVRLVVREVV